jgi:hypothetical protein
MGNGELDRDAPAAPGPARGTRPADVDLGDLLFGDAPGDGRTGPVAYTVSTEIAAAVDRRAARFQRAAVVAAVLAAVVAVAGVAAARWAGGPGDVRAAAAAHLQAADRLLADGRLTGKDGALEHLLAARRLRPDDPGTAARLERIADLLERLAVGALERGDLAVAAIHLGAARAAAPDRPSLRAKQAELDRRVGAAAAPGAR